MTHSIDGIPMEPPVTATQAEIDRAHFEAQLQEAGLPPPNMRSANEDASETWLGWKHNGVHALYLNFEGDGHYGASLRRDGSWKACAEDGVLIKAMPADLVAYLREMQSS